MTFIKLFLEDRLESLIFYYDLPRMCFDLLTYAPLLVTEQVTVDTALQNLMTKESLSVFSEEGVYKVVIDIVLQRSSETFFYYYVDFTRPRLLNVALGNSLKLVA